MGCLVVLLVLAMPRFVMVMLWLFSDYLSRAYDGWILPLIGFFVLPTTTLAYAVAENESSGRGVGGWGIVLIVVGFLIDTGMWGRGRGALKRS